MSSICATERPELNLPFSLIALDFRYRLCLCRDEAARQTARRAEMMKLQDDHLYTSSWGHEKYQSIASLRRA
jgi:hypothetical protein